MVPENKEMFKKTKAKTKTPSLRGSSRRGIGSQLKELLR